MSWWADAHCFFPILFGPVAFLATVLPGLAELLGGQSVNHTELLARGLVRLVVYSGAGYIVGLVLHWLIRLGAAGLGRGLDVTVGGESESGAASKPQPVSVTISIGVEHLEPGMKLADALLGGEGQQLAPSGALLSEELIEAARQTGASVLRVEGVKYSGPSSPEGEAEPAAEPAGATVE